MLRAVGIVCAACVVSKEIDIVRVLNVGWGLVELRCGSKIVVILCAGEKEVGYGVIVSCCWSGWPEVP